MWHRQLENDPSDPMTRAGVVVEHTNGDASALQKAWDARGWPARMASQPRARNRLQGGICGINNLQQPKLFQAAAHAGCLQSLCVPEEGWSQHTAKQSHDTHTDAAAAMLVEDEMEMKNVALFAELQGDTWAAVP
ncbi:hypothetical protein NUW54_g14345 [Trametes sanguinea]|uniref:Uncharacterized protein n=1 Tax=Trametes sanguinea TaxID=158606 RepID=A0ACC1MF01_9APHY|nr:hypothetical protein NUW54_g14345 [Trametes sanguinea]